MALVLSARTPIRSSFPIGWCMRVLQAKVPKARATGSWCSHMRGAQHSGQIGLKRFWLLYE